MTTFAKTPRPERKCSLHNRGEYTGSFSKCPWCSEPKALAACDKPKPTARLRDELLERWSEEAEALGFRAGLTTNDDTHLAEVLELFLPGEYEESDFGETDRKKDYEASRVIDESEATDLLRVLRESLEDTWRAFARIGRDIEASGSYAAAARHEAERLDNGLPACPETRVRDGEHQTCACGNRASWNTLRGYQCDPCFTQPPNVNVNTRCTLVPVPEQSTPRYADGTECKVGDAVRTGTNDVGIVIGIAESGTHRLRLDAFGREHKDHWHAGTCTPIRDPDELAGTLRVGDSLAVATVDGGRARHVLGPNPGQYSEGMYEIVSPTGRYGAGAHGLARMLRDGATILRREQEGA